MKADRRHAPPVGVVCSGGVAWRAVQALLAACAAAAFAAWAALMLEASDGVAGSLALAGALLAGAAAWFAARPRPARLNWDGRQWTADDEPGDVDLMLDLGAWLLLRFRASRGGERWLPVANADAGAARHALRAALYSRAALHTSGER